MANTTLETAKQSPRYENGKLYWYLGDNFKITFTINITKDDKPYTLQPTDKIIIEFFDMTDTSITKFEFTGEDISDNKVVMNMTKELTSLFSAKSYCYCMKYIDADNNSTTISANNMAVVEKCH